MVCKDNQPFVTFGVHIFQMTAISKRIEQFWPASNWTEMFHIRTCVQNSYNIYQSVWSLSPSNKRKNLLSLSLRKRIMLTSLANQITRTTWVKICYSSETFQGNYVVGGEIVCYGSPCIIQHVYLWTLPCPVILVWGGLIFQKVYSFSAK